MSMFKLLLSLNDQGIELWVDGDKLRYKDPSNALTPALREILVTRKHEILSYLHHVKSQSSPIASVSRDARVPLSFAQQRLWFLDRLDPGQSVYNVSVAYRFSGSLNVSALEQSLHEIVQRHEVLRTRFPTKDGKPMQEITPNLEVTLPIIDLQHLPEPERPTVAQHQVNEEAQRPFDLVHGPLFRAILWQLEEEEYILLLVMHHIVADGWSMDILFRELSTLYKAFSTGKRSPLPDLQIQYADFTIWQREWLKKDRVESHISYWETQLQGLSVLELPTDRPKPTVQSYRGASIAFVLSEDLSHALKELSLQEKATSFMTFLAAVNLLLFRYTRQHDIAVGSPMTNRNRLEIEQLIGFFVNTLVFRTDISGNPTFRELLKRVREVCLEAYAHQELPFEKIVEILQPERSLAHHPLFQAMFAFQQASASPQLLGLSVRRFPLENTTAKFDLGFSIQEQGEVLLAEINYNTDRFEAATITRMSKHFLELLHGIVTNPDERLSQLAFLTEAERYQLLVEWNDTQADYPINVCIHQLFEGQVKRSPDVVAVIFEEQQLTYQALNSKANQFAHSLQQQGVGPEVLVGLCVERSIEMIIGMLGILKAGGAYVPLDPIYPRNRLEFMMTDARLSVLVTQERLLSRLPALDVPRICVDIACAEILWEDMDDPRCETGGAHRAYIMYTSGSTGRAKGVEMTHRALVNYILGICQSHDIGSSDRLLQFASLNFDASVEEIFSAFVGGAALVLRSHKMLDSIAIFLQQCEQWGITILDPPTAYLHELADGVIAEHLRWPSQLRLVYFGGERAIPQKMVALQQALKNHVRLVNGYGPTEATICATRYELYNGTKDSALLHEVPIGHPIQNVHTYILDQNLSLVPIGLAGELYIGGDGVARGYLNRPDLTAERFLPDSFCQAAGARIYKTGDLVRYLPDGTIEFLGRLDHQVKIRGFRIELGEIESILRQHPLVREVVVLARQDAHYDKRLVAYVVTTQRSAPLTEEFRQFLKQQLPEYMIPAAFIFLEVFPLTPNGKIDRNALPAPDWSRPDLETAFVAPRTPVEKTLTEIWKTVLHVENIGIYDNFFTLGGHSLLATQVMFRIRHAFQRDIPLRRFFEHPTVAELSECIEDIRKLSGSQQMTSITPISRETNRMKRSSTGDLMPINTSQKEDL